MKSPEALHFGRPCFRLVGKRLFILRRQRLQSFDLVLRHFHVAAKGRYISLRPASFVFELASQGLSIKSLLSEKRFEFLFFLLGLYFGDGQFILQTRLIRIIIFEALSHRGELRVFVHETERKRVFLGLLQLRLGPVFLDLILESRKLGFSGSMLFLQSCGAFGGIGSGLFPRFLLGGRRLFLRFLLRRDRRRLSGGGSVFLPLLPCQGFPRFLFAQKLPRHHFLIEGGDFYSGAERVQRFGVLFLFLREAFDDVAQVVAASFSDLPGCGPNRPQLRSEPERSIRLISLLGRHGRDEERLRVPAEAVAEQFGERRVAVADVAFLSALRLRLELLDHLPEGFEAFADEAALDLAQFLDRVVGGAAHVDEGHFPRRHVAAVRGPAVVPVDPHRQDAVGPRREVLLEAHSALGAPPAALVDQREHLVGARHHALCEVLDVEAGGSRR